jgi:glycosyl hydrolase family 26
MISPAKTTRRNAAVAIALALACLLLVPTTGAAKPRPMYWGAWIGDQLTGEQAPWDMTAVSRFEALVHKGLSLIEFSAPFSDCAKTPCSRYPFPSAQMQSVRDYGAIPFFSWNSGASGTSDFSAHRLSDINSGAYDSYIREFAGAARDWGHPFFLRFNWEMNGNWFPWSEGVNGNGPGEYVAAWRRVHDIFAAVGATNATWVWCPYGDTQRRLLPMRQFYPGSRYVDWTCLDGFNWGQNASNPLPWGSFEDIFHASYEQVVGKIAPHKPMILAETASNGGGKAKAAWIRGMFQQIALRYRQIRGLIWFDQVDRDLQWQVESSAASASAFSQGIRKHPYRANRFGSLAASPIQPPG